MTQPTPLKGQLIFHRLVPLGTPFHRMSANVHLLLVCGTTSKHTISVPPSPHSDTYHMRLNSNWTTAHCKSFTYPTY